MPLPKSLVQSFRQGQLVVGAGWRGYFSPFNLQAAVQESSTQIGPTIYDLLVQASFVDTTTGIAGQGTLPAGWWDLGYIDKFKATPGSKTGNVMSGYRAAVRAKYRADTSEKMSFVFKEQGHMQMKIANGTQVFNLLKSTAPVSIVGPLSSSGIPAVPMGAIGYQPTGAPTGPTTGLPTLFVPGGSGAAFPAGTYIVCDQDYAGQTGFVGDAGANVFPGAVTDIDFIRKTSDYVACVQQVVLSASGGQDALILTKQFVGGGNAPYGQTPNYYPTAGAKIQIISGYASREGGTFIKEWSAIFTLNTVDSSQIVFYYPRIAPDAFAGFDANNLQNATSLQTYELNSSYDALAFDDPLDGETVVCYRAYFPTSGLQIQI